MPATRRVLPWLVRIGLTVAITWFILRQVGVGAAEVLAVGRSLPDLSILPLAAATGVFLGASLLVARLWGRMVSELGGRDPGAADSIRIVFTANLGRYLPGKVWPVAGLALLSRREGDSGTLGATAGLLGQAFSLVAAAIVATPVWFASREPALAGGGAGAAWLAALVGVGVIGVSSPPVLRAGLLAAFRVARIPGERLPVLGWSFGPRWLGWHLLAWTGYGVSFALFLEGLGFGGDPVGVAGAFAAAYLLGYLAFFAPAGLGVREGFLVAFLRPALGGSAVAVAVLARLWMTVLEVVPAGAMALRDGWTRARRGGEGPAAAEASPTGRERK